MIKRFAFESREVKDCGVVFISVETEDNQTETRDFAEKLIELVASLPITGVNVQVMDFYEANAFKAPKIK